MEVKNKNARLAGISFIIVLICGIFAEFFIRQRFFWKDDIVTVINIPDFEWLIRLGFISDSVMSIAFLFYAYFLFKIFTAVNKNLSLLMFTSVGISVAILCFNMLNQSAVFLLLSDSNLSNVFNPDQLQSLNRFFQIQHSYGYKISQIFYGLYMFPLGYMIYKSKYIPIVIGIFLMLGCITDLFDFTIFFLIPNNNSAILQNITIPADIGEISLCLWLLIKGIRNQD